MKKVLFSFCQNKIKYLSLRHKTKQISIAFNSFSVMATINYTKKEVNGMFKIKVYGKNGNGKKLNTLVGVSGLIKLVGVELFNKFIARAKKICRNADKCVCKLRRGLQVTFYMW